MCEMPRVFVDSNFTVGSVKIDYVRRPVILSATNSGDYTTEFPLHVLRLLIDATARRILELVQSQRFQTKTIEMKS